MKLDEGISYQKLSLDITPLIDIIFLLVLFFAVSTSFITGEDLETIKNKLVALTEDKVVLSKDLNQTAEEAKNLGDKLVVANSRTQELEDNIVSLKNERAITLNNYDLLTLQHDTLKRERKNQEKQEVLLNQTIVDRTAENQRLEQQLKNAENERSDLEQTALNLQSSLAKRESLQREIQLSLNSANKENGLLNSALEKVRREVGQLENELASFQKAEKLNSEQIERILAAQQTLESGLGEFLENDQLNIKREKQRLILQLPDQILFDSGSAKIKGQGAKLLRGIGATIKAQLSSMQVQIGGHTDSVPISSKQGPWPNNWALSAARAVNVLRILEEDEVGIDSRFLSAVGYGEHRPIADNDTVSGRAKNRRIEIVLIPQ